MHLKHPPPASWATAPYAAILGRAIDLSSAPSRRLGMAVRTEESEVLEPIVEPISIDVVDDQSQRVPLPAAVASAHETVFGDSTGDHRSAKPGSAHPVGARWQNNENLAWWPSPTRRPPPLMRLPKEM